MKPAAERFKVGDIVRYARGVSALFRYDGPVNAGRLYGTHVLGGAIGACDQTFFDLQPASAEDIEFCKGKRPDWFAADETRQTAAATISQAINAIPAGLFWLIGKGRTRPGEPLYAIQLIDPESGIAIAEAEAEELVDAINAGIKQLAAYQRTLSGLAAAIQRQPDTHHPEET